MTSIVIAIPFFDREKELILESIEIDYGEQATYTTFEKENLHAKLAAWLYEKNYKELIAFRKDPIIYVEHSSRMNDADFVVKDD